MNSKSLLKLLISCFVMVLSSVVQAQGYGYVCDDFTEDYDKSKVGFTQQFNEWPMECKLKLVNQESIIDPVIECYDKKGVKHLLSLNLKNEPVKDSIDITKPIILHLMVDEYEIPLKYYKFLTFCCMDGNQYESNRAEMSERGKRFLLKASKCDYSLYFWLSPDDSPSELYPIGPFSKNR